MKKILAVQGEQAHQILGLLTAVATDEGKLPLHSIHARTVKAVGEHLLNTEVDPADLDVSLMGAGSKVTDPELRHEVLNIAAVLPFLEVETMAQKIDAFTRLSANFGFDHRYGRELLQLSHKKAGHLELDNLRAAALEFGAPAWKVALKIAAGFFHLDGDKHLLARYKRYQEMDDAIFGKALTNYYRDNHFALPGTPGAPFSNALRIHDMHHVLAGYPTTPLGELCVLSFDGALMNEDAGKTLIVAIAQWQVGFKVSSDPVWKNQFNPDVVMRAYERGAKCCVNYLQPHFDFTHLLEEKLEDVRMQFNIAPEGALVKDSSDLWCGDMGVVGSRVSEDKVEEKRSFIHRLFVGKNTTS